MNGLTATDLSQVLDVVLGVLMIIAMGLAGLMPIAVLIARVQARTHRSAGRRVLVYLESAARIGAPLPEMMEAAARTEGGRMGRRLWFLSEQLRAGRSLRDALAIATPQVPARLRELIGGAERTGRLREGLTSLVERERRSDQVGVRAVEWVYPIVVLTVLTMVVSGVLVFVWPKFQEIFADFGTELPLVTRVVLGRDAVGAYMWFTVVLGFMAGGIALACVLLFFHRWTGWASPLFLSSAPNPLMVLARRVPLIGRALRDQQLADVCYIVGAGLRSAMPMDTAVLEARTLRIDPALRRLIVRWADALRSGRTPEQAARVARMPRLMCGMLATGQASNHPTEAFEFLERYYAGRFSRALELLRGAIVPAAVLALGTITGLMVLAMLSPLFALINRTAAEVYP